MKQFIAVVMVFVVVMAAIFYSLGYTNGSRETAAKFSELNATANVTTPIWGDPNINSSSVGWVAGGDLISVQKTQCDFYYISYRQPTGDVVRGWVENRFVTMNAVGSDD